MSELGEPMHDHPDEIKLAGRETHNEIYANVFPFPRRNVQGLQQSDRSHMIGLDPLTHVTFCNIASSLTLHSSPQELRFQIMIHICAVGVNGIFGSMSLTEHLLA
jgi:hypothetical protein